MTKERAQICLLLLLESLLPILKSSIRLIVLQVLLFTILKEFLAAYYLEPDYLSCATEIKKEFKDFPALFAFHLC